jgi:hypothetical protein
MGAVEISSGHGGGLMRAPAFLDSESRLPGMYPRNGKITNRYNASHLPRTSANPPATQLYLRICVYRAHHPQLSRRQSSVMLRRRPEPALNIRQVMYTFADMFPSYSTSYHTLHSYVMLHRLPPPSRQSFNAARTGIPQHLRIYSDGGSQRRSIF